MNRREFLISLAALGGAVALPLDGLAKTPDTVVDELWAQALEQPLTFYVNEYGALSADAVEGYPTTRKELLGYDDVASREELIALVEDDGYVESVIECEFSDTGAWFDDPEILSDDWRDWLVVTDDETIDRLIGRVNDWINDLPDERDYERADLGGSSGRGHALRFFRDDFEYGDDFDIVIVEGDCPGSSYFAAELRMDIDEANAYAVAYCIPIRFAAQG